MNTTQLPFSDLQRRGRGFCALLLFGVLAASVDCRSRKAPAPEGSTSAALGSAASAGRGGMAFHPDPLATRLCRALHTSPAERRAACCHAPVAAPLFAACERLVSDARAAHNIALSPARVEACENALREEQKSCDWVTPRLAHTPLACQALFVGKLGADARCRSSLECQGTLHCEGLTPTVAGVCAAPNPDGGGCGSHADGLATYTLTRDLEQSHPSCSAFCDRVAHHCRPLPEAGAPCRSPADCAPEQTCSAGHCSAEPPAAAGEACGARPCATGLRCLDEHCAPLGKAGEPCTLDLDCALGGCTAAEDGGHVCGMKCTPGLDALKVMPGLRLGFPARPPRPPPGRAP